MDVSKLLSIIIAFCFFLTSAQAQTILDRYWVYLADKENNTYSVDNPEEFLSQAALDRRIRCGIGIDETDLPVSESYVSEIEANGVEILHTSRWFNAVAVSFDNEQEGTIEAIEDLPFVTGTLLLEQRIVNGKLAGEEPAPLGAPTPIPGFYGTAGPQIEMLKGEQLHNSNYDGEGVTLAVFDSGFTGVDQVDAFQHLFQDNRILSTYNYVENEINVFDKNDHGTFVFSILAANKPDEFVGVAPGANYHLFITENSNSERRIEEVNYVVAAEKSDSLGVDIITCSLNYAIFQGGDANYDYEDMNGSTTIISRGANMAAEKGILVVNSAGNNFNSDWEKITAPADAPQILSVGLVNAAQVFDDFGATGPTIDGRIKPEVVAQGIETAVLDPNGNFGNVNGTSYATPLVSGLAACLWQCSLENKCSDDIKSAIVSTASKSANPNNQIGYGIPDFAEAHEALQFCAPLGINEIAELEENPFSLQSGFLLIKENANMLEYLRIVSSSGQVLLEQKLDQSTHKIKLPLGLEEQNFLLVQGFYPSGKSVGQQLFIR